MTPDNGSDFDSVLEREAKTGKENLLAVAALVAIGILVAVFIRGHDDHKSQSSRSFQDIHDCNTAEDLIRERLRAPYSAKFECAQNSTPMDDGRLMIVEVNAKNGFQTWGVLFMENNRYRVIGPE